jgi:cellulose synthase/poly-beta-1,6-N-acetylglucosamine synthase-like glycosyltransferase
VYIFDNFSLKNTHNHTQKNRWQLLSLQVLAKAQAIANTVKFSIRNHQQISCPAEPTGCVNSTKLKKFPIVTAGVFSLRWLKAPTAGNSNTSLIRRSKTILSAVCLIGLFGQLVASF